MINKNPIQNIDFLNETSLLDISSIVKWKKKLKKYNFEKLPKTAIISLNKYVLNQKTRFLSKKIKGLIGQNFILNKNIIYCSEFGNGAPAIVGILEELRILGVENFIFIGLAGIISKKSNSEDVFLVNNCYSTTGCTDFYSKKESLKPTYNLWFQNLKSQLNLPETICWSTDAPFRETKSLLSFYIEKQATHVDMECAAIYAFADFHKVNALCCVVSADDLSDYFWKPPSNLKTINSSLKATVSKFIAIIK